MYIALKMRAFDYSGYEIQVVIIKIKYPVFFWGGRGVYAFHFMNVVYFISFIEEAVGREHDLCIIIVNLTTIIDCTKQLYSDVKRVKTRKPRKAP